MRQLSDPVTAPAQTPALVRWSQTVALAAVGAALSLFISGAVSGEGTNEFHLGILAALWREPQFADDRFVQSLQYYASGFGFLWRGGSRAKRSYRCW